MEQPCNKVKLKRAFDLTCTLFLEIILLSKILHFCFRHAKLAFLLSFPRACVPKTPGTRERESRNARPALSDLQYTCKCLTYSIPVSV